MNPKIIRLLALCAVPVVYLILRPYMSVWAEDWEWAVLIVGVFLLGLEVFIIPGFGIAGIVAFAFMYVGLVCMMLNNKGTDFSSITSAELVRALIIGGLLLGVVLIGLLACVPSILHSSNFQNMAHNSTLHKADEFASLQDLPKMVGKSGVAETILRPSGKIRLENKIFDATTLGDFIEKGEAITVIAQDGSALRVKKNV